MSKVEGRPAGSGRQRQRRWHARWLELRCCSTERNQHCSGTASGSSPYASSKQRERRPLQVRLPATWVSPPPRIVLTESWEICRYAAASPRRSATPVDGGPSSCALSQPVPLLRWLCIQSLTADRATAHMHGAGHAAATAAAWLPRQPNRGVRLPTSLRHDLWPSATDNLQVKCRDLMVI